MIIKYFFRHRCPPVDRLIDEWLTTKKTYTKYSTFVKYQSTIAKHVRPFFHEHPLHTLDAPTISQYLSDLVNQGYSLSTVKINRYVILAILTYASDQYHIKIPDCKYIKLPSARSKEVGSINPEAAKWLTAYCYKNYDFICLATLLGLYAGMRVGEVCGLKWGDIDLKTGIIFVQRTVQRLPVEHPQKKKTALMLQDPKSQNSRRAIPLPASLLAYLNDYIRQHGNISPEHFVLSGRDTPIDPRIVQARFHTLAKKFHISASFHALRHTYATQCVQCGMDIKSLSEILGHASTTTTLEHYVHSSLDFKIAQVKKIPAPAYSPRQ